MRYLIFTFLVLFSLAVIADYYLSLAIRGFQTGLPQEQAIKYPIIRPSTKPVNSVATTSTSTYLNEGGQKKFLGPTVKPSIIGPKSPPPGAE